MTTRRAGVIVLLALALAGCGAGSASTSADTPSTVATPRYQVDATVLESGAHGPQLCAGGVEDSLPPQCGGPSIAGWDWSAVDNEQSVNGTTWGDYHLVGTYDGTTFTLTESASAPRPRTPAALPNFATPCPEPPGGWGVVDPSKVALSDYQAFMSAAQSPPDYAGMWVDESTNHDGIAGVPIKTVMNVAYTGSLDQHRADLAAVWGGPICVVSHARSEADLRAIQSEIVADNGKALGLQIQSSFTDDVANVVNATAMVLDEGAQSRADDRYGVGVVVLDAYLKPAT